MTRLDPAALRASYRSLHDGKSAGHRADERTRPSILRYDYLSLRRLADDIRDLIASAEVPADGGRALDLGSATSPYRAWVEARGMGLETLDIDADSGADHVGTAEATGLPDQCMTS